MFENPHKVPPVLDRLLKAFGRHGGHAGLVGVGLVFLLVAVVWYTISASLRQAVYLKVAEGKKDDQTRADAQSEEPHDMTPLVASAMAVGAGKAFGV